MRYALCSLASLVEAPFYGDDEVLDIGENGPGREGAAVGQFIDGEFRHVHGIIIDRPHVIVCHDVIRGHHISGGNGVELRGEGNYGGCTPCKGPHAILCLISITDDFRYGAIIPDRPRQHEVDAFPEWLGLQLQRVLDQAPG